MEKDEAILTNDEQKALLVNTGNGPQDGDPSQDDVSQEPIVHRGQA